MSQSLVASTFCQSHSSVAAMVMVTQVMNRNLQNLPLSVAILVSRHSPLCEAALRENIISKSARVRPGR